MLPPFPGSSMSPTIALAHLSTSVRRPRAASPSRLVPASTAFRSSLCCWRVRRETRGAAPSAAARSAPSGCSMRRRQAIVVAWTALRSSPRSAAPRAILMAYGIACGSRPCRFCAAILRSSAEICFRYSRISALASATTAIAAWAIARVLLSRAAILLGLPRASGLPPPLA